jgi:L-lactate dehydrogenase complex protein LldE
MRVPASTLATHRRVAQHADWSRLMPEAHRRAVERPPIKVGLFVTCLVDLFRPSIGFAALDLLERAGCVVEVPAGQTCCGQPAYNSGDPQTAREIAQGLLDTFEGYDYVVAPSGSCAGMISQHLAELFADDPEKQHRARHLGARTHELVSFLVDILGVTTLSARFEGTVAYHDSCSGLRELDVKSQPRRLLVGVEGLVLKELKEPEVCCGFGGTFCVKYPQISDAMVSNKLRDIEVAGAGTVWAGDLGCLLNMAGKASRSGSKVEFRHIAEVLAGTDGTPAIGRRK